MGMRQPAMEKYTDHASFAAFLDIHQSVVVKPSDGSHGNGVTTNLTNVAQLDEAVRGALAASKSKTVLLQEHITGHDVRVLIIDGKLAAAAVRTPADVIGDGTHTIAALIDTENASDLRGTEYHTSLNVISREAATAFLGSGYIETSVPALGEHVQVVGTANIGTGGTATDITDVLPKAIIDQSVRLLQELSLQCGGVDFIASDLEDASSYCFIEVNASPSFGLHLKPTHGSSKQVQKLFVDMLIRDSLNQAPQTDL